MQPKYVGLTVASFYIVFKLVLYFAGIQYDVLLGKAAMVLIALVMLGIFYSINFYVRNSATYDWMAAFKKALTVSLVASIVVGVFVFVYYRLMDSFYLEQMSINEYNRMKTLIKPEQMEAFTKSLKDRYTPGNFAIMTVSLVNIVGLLSSLILSLLGRITVRQK